MGSLQQMWMVRPPSMRNIEDIWTAFGSRGWLSRQSFWSNSIIWIIVHFISNTNKKFTARFRVYRSVQIEETLHFLLLCYVFMFYALRYRRHIITQDVSSHLWLDFAKESLIKGDYLNIYTIKDAYILHASTHMRLQSNHINALAIFKCVVSFAHPSHAHCFHFQFRTVCYSYWDIGLLSGKPTR